MAEGVSARGGRVTLVGAGPGDPRLLTLGALEHIQAADVVVYDRLVSGGVLRLVPQGIPRIYVGKAPGAHTFPQDEINHRLVKLARSGHSVVRLKGGDPYLFGRGGEEALYLREHGIPFEVVPGVTSASACAASCGIPLTHRGLANSVQFVTGHCRAGEPLDLAWDQLAHRDTTVVFYMGISTVAELREGLLRAGRAPGTPAAIVERGTLPGQRHFTTTLGELVDAVHRHQVSSPAVIIIGEVTTLAAMLGAVTDDGIEAVAVAPASRAREPAVAHG